MRIFPKDPQIELVSSRRKGQFIMILIPIDEKVNWVSEQHFTNHLKRVCVTLLDTINFRRPK